MEIFKENGTGVIPRIKVTLTIDYDNARIADSILRSVNVDNQSFISCERKETKIICVLSGKNAATLRHTLDDFLSCVLMAESAYQNI